MISFLKNLRFDKLKARRYKLNSGMTYVELIVVLGIWAVMSSIVIFNYGEFQARVDIKSLASDIALKIVEAQKSALSGNSPSLFGGLKPSYGVHFFYPVDKIRFVYFNDLNSSSNGYDSTEALDTVSITKNNSISSIDQCTVVDCSSGAIPINNPLSVTFKRPDSKAVFYVNNVVYPVTGYDYVQITITSPKSATAKIKIYPSGRVQVN